MRKAQVDPHGIYRVKVSGRIVRVQLLGLSSLGGWEARNLATGRSVRIRTAARLREPVDAPAPALQIPGGNP